VAVEDFLLINWGEADDAPGGWVPADVAEQLGAYFSTKAGAAQVDHYVSVSIN
jgi:hypothetical protein